MKILVINGPNINMLGTREPELYGTTTYEALCMDVYGFAARNKIEVEIFQSNHEGALIDKIQQAYGNVDGIVINPAAYTHTSIAILDALKAVSLPTVEVHITDPDKREPFRQINYIRPACLATFAGEGVCSYTKAMQFLMDHLGAKA